MNILVTGGAGYIGTHTCLELLENGYGVVVIDNLSNSSTKSLERVQAMTGKQLRFYQGDVRDENLLRKIFAENDIAAVIHFAGLKAVGESVQQPWHYYDHNLNTSLILTRIMAEVGVKRIIFSSSATVYDSDNTMPLQETSRVGNCTNPYAWSKYMTEVILQGLCNGDPQWSAVVLRYFNPVGAHESGNIGEDPRVIPNNLMPFITQVAIGRREYLNVFGNDYPTRDGTGERDYIHVVDLAKGHMAAIEYVTSHTGWEVFNLGTSVGYSVMDIVKTFQRVNHMDLPYKIAPRRAGDLAFYWGDPTKAGEVLGWKAQRGMDEMCRDAWNWQCKNPNGYEE